VGIETGKRHYSCRVACQIGGAMFAIIMSHPAESQNQSTALSDAVNKCITETVDKIIEEI